jgi:predicted phage terminase large subunit-like protein
VSLSILDQIAALPTEAREAYLLSLTEEQLDLFRCGDWSVKARPEQLPPPGEWFAWFIRAGRGWGKTETGAETTLENIRWLAPRVDVVRWFAAAPTRGDARGIMFEGETGLKRKIPPSELLGGSWERSFNKSELILTLANGATIHGLSSEKAARARGLQWHGGWADEPGTFADAHLGLDEDTFVAMLLFGLRLDPRPRMIVTGTPKNNRLVKELRRMEGVVETHGRTRENLHNLSRAFKSTVVARYAGTRLGRQELDAEIIEGVGSMFQRGWFRRAEHPPWPPGTYVQRERYWDLASGEPSDSNADPDWTAGALVQFSPAHRMYFIEHIARFRLSPGQRELRIRQHAVEDGLGHIWIEKEPGNAGKAQLHMIGKELEAVGVAVKGHPVTGPKPVRAQIVASAAEQGRVFMLDADWNAALLDELEEFPDVNHDDQVDCLAGCMSRFLEATEMSGSSSDLFAGAVR